MSGLVTVAPLDLYRSLGRPLNLAPWLNMLVYSSAYCASHERNNRAAQPRLTLRSPSARYLPELLHAATVELGCAFLGAGGDWRMSKDSNPDYKALEACVLPLHYSDIWQRLQESNLCNPGQSRMLHH